MLCLGGRNKPVVHPCVALDAAVQGPEQGHAVPRSDCLSLGLAPPPMGQVKAQQGRQPNANFNLGQQKPLSSEL